MTKSEWKQICQLAQMWYYIQIFDDKEEGLKYAKEHPLSDEVLNDGRIEFFQENFKPELVNEKMLNELAYNEAQLYSIIKNNDWIEGFEAGYKKAMEE